MLVEGLAPGQWLEQDREVLECAGLFSKVSIGRQMLGFQGTIATLYLGRCAIAAVHKFGDTCHS